jgi:YD repeat-containing protein
MSAERVIKKYNDDGREIYRCRPSNGYEKWTDYDENSRIIHTRQTRTYIAGEPASFEVWFEYDKRGNMIHYRDSNGHEVWYEYDAKGKLVKASNHQLL